MLIVAANGGVTLTPAVEEAFDRGTPVIMMDRKILSDKCTAYIGTDNYGSDKAIDSCMAHRPKGHGRVVELSGLIGSAPIIEHHQDSMNGVNQYPGATLPARKDAGWLR